jgi:hypothetical protein
MSDPASLAQPSVHDDQRRVDETFGKKSRQKGEHGPRAMDFAGEKPHIAATTLGLRCVRLREISTS